MSRTRGLIISLIILLVAICGGMAVGMVVQEAHAQDWPLDFALPQTAPQQAEIGCCACMTCQIEILPPARPTPAFPHTVCLTGTVEGVDKRACCYSISATYQIQDQCYRHCLDAGYTFGSGTYGADYTPYARQCIKFSERWIFPLILK